MGQETASGTDLLGAATFRRVGPWWWRRYELIQHGTRLARVGRRSWLSIYFGFGQRIELGDGTRGRLTAQARGGLVVPTIIDARREVVGRASPGPAGTYAVNVASAGYRLVALSPNSWRRRSSRWQLLRHDLVVADLDLRAGSIVTSEAIPMAAVILSFTVMALGIPGEADLGLRNSGWS